MSTAKQITEHLKRDPDRALQSIYLDEGFVNLEMPINLSPESTEDFCHWMEGTVKRLKRRAARAENKPNFNDNCIIDLEKRQ